MFARIVAAILGRPTSMGPPPPTSGLKEVRSMYGDAFHLITTDQWEDLVEGKTLCGKNSWTRASNGEDIVPEDVIEASKKKFDSWFYCGTCVTTMTAAEAPSVS